jgi:hypothetical protein
MILPGTYANGFAPRDGQPLYPELWRGCVGAWAPCLGPTGLSLRDWSGRGNHGTLTNMVPGEDWVASQGRYALDFDGSNDRVEIPASSTFNNQNFSITIRIFMRANTNNAVKTILDLDHAGLNNWVIQSETATTTARYYLAYMQTGLGFTATTGSSNGIAIPLNIFSILTYTKIGKTIVGYLDGVPVWTPAEVASESVQFLATSAMRIGTVVSNSFASERHVNCQMDSVMIHNRGLSLHEIRLLASRRGIAYEMAPRRRSSSAVQFNRRRRLLVGAH